MILLDTHVLVWMGVGDRRLGRKSRALIERYWVDGGVCAAAISFWEVALLVSRGRIELPCPVAEWREQILSAGLTEIALDGLIGIRATELLAAPPDPADRLIAATALVSGATLVTADEKLLRWIHPLQRQDAQL